MIDIWFLFLLILIVLTIIGHTVITLLLGSESAENKVFGNHRRLFNRRGTSAAVSQNGSAGTIIYLKYLGSVVGLVIQVRIILHIPKIQNHGSDSPPETTQYHNSI